MQYIRDIVFNNDKNSGTDLCFQMEYDSSILLEDILMMSQSQIQVIKRIVLPKLLIFLSIY